jgi:hypothetical protein
LKEEPTRIWLAEAFRAVVDRAETMHNVDQTNRLGAAIGSALPISLPRIEAVGPRFGTRFTSGRQPLRGGGYSALQPPAVPAVPDAEQLRLLLEDDVRSEEDTSPAERRVCAAHRWLAEALRSGRIRAWAREWIVPPEQGWEGVCTASDVLIPPGQWDEAECDLDYRSDTLRSHRDFETRLNGHRIRGRLILDQIALDEVQLSAALQDLRAIGVRAELHIGSDNGRDTWTIAWNAQNWRVETPCTEKPSRGMCAIALLLRTPDVLVSYDLLDGLKRKSGHTRQKNSEWNRMLDQLHEKIDPISRRVFEQAVDIDEAEKAVAAACRGFERQASKSFEENRRNNRPRAGERVRASVKDALNRIRESGDDLGPIAAEYLRISLKADKKKRGYRYFPGSAPVTWKSITSLAQGAEQAGTEQEAQATGEPAELREPQN